jgi:hypothetical protein
VSGYSEKNWGRQTRVLKTPVNCFNPGEGLNGGCEMYGDNPGSYPAGKKGYGKKTLERMGVRGTVSDTEDSMRVELLIP